MHIKKIRITPTWSFHDEAGNQLDPHLFAILRSIHDKGKLTVAAQEAGISYRHAWNLLNKWAAFFGCPLVELQRGRGASLSPLGDKLLWAEKRVVARLEPQMKNLTSELNLEINRTLVDVNPLLRMHASYGYAVALLPEFAQNIQLDIQYKSAVDALASLGRGACDIAGFHVPTEVHSDALIDTYSRYIRPRVHRIIGFITRWQGLMVKPGNPKDIRSIADLARPCVKFINRQKDSGTRGLLDELMRREGMKSSQISGFDDEEFTHSAVAAYVGAGMADVGFGIEAAARQFGLDFLPVTTEYYLIMCHQRSLEQESIRRFLAMISQDSFYQAVRQLPGYSPSDCGRVMAVEDMLPWYRR
jgi:molybdate transport repressor ModE-like protein